MVDRFRGMVPTVVKTDDARQIARHLSEQEGLPPGFELGELIEDLGGDLLEGRAADLLHCGGSGPFRIEHVQRPEAQAREIAAELFGMFVLPAVAGTPPDRPVTLRRADCEQRSRALLAGFARELLVPGRQLRNLAEFYGFRAGAEWKSGDIAFLASLFEVPMPCLELRLAEENMLTVGSGRRPRGGPAGKNGKGAG